MNLTGTEIKTLQAIYCRYTHLLENEINSQTCRYIYKNMNKGGKIFKIVILWNVIVVEATKFFGGLKNNILQKVILYEILHFYVCIVIFDK